MPSWRLLISPAASGAENMALDEALKDRARDTGEWTARVYAWSTPTISLGRNQSARGKYDVGKIAAEGIDILRRPTGGRAILHHHEITYSVTAPVSDAGDLPDSYSRINRLLLAALRSMGVGAELAVVRHAPPPGMAPCFNEPSAGELMLNGRKLAGSAQWRSEGALLQHGSILTGDDQSLLSGLALGAGTSIPAPATLADALGRTPAVEEVAGALACAIEEIDGCRPVPLLPDDALRARTAALVVRYLDDAWTWRR